jgi:hypothetical protein
LNLELGNFPWGADFFAVMRKSPRATGGTLRRGPENRPISSASQPPIAACLLHNRRCLQEQVVNGQRRDEFIGHAHQGPPSRPALPFSALVIAASLVMLAAVLLVMHQRGVFGGAPVAAGRGADISFPLSDFADGQARFYRYTTASGKEIRFFIMRSADGITRAAFDTCDVCFREKRGYRQAGHAMICNNCEQSFPSASINDIRGGCNPAPLERVIDGDRLVLRAAALEQGAAYY